MIILVGARPGPGAQDHGGVLSSWTALVGSSGLGREQSQGPAPSFCQPGPQVQSLRACSLPTWPATWGQSHLDEERMEELWA